MKRLGNMVVYFLIILIAVYLLLCTYLYFNQRNLVFIPSKNLAVTPSNMKLAYDDITIPVEDSDIVHGWFIPSAIPSDKVVLFCHGNAGNISHRLETIWLLHQLGINSLFFDYRGFGQSTGVPDEKGVYADALACYNWLVRTKQYKPENIFLFGRSLGGAVAIDLSTKVPSAGLIVESSFTSASDVAQKIFPYFPIRALLRVSFNSLDKIPQVTTPVLVTHSPEDDIIPFEMGEKLFAVAVSPKRFFAFTGRHNDRIYLQDSAYIAVLSEFLGLKPPTSEN